MNDQSIGGEDIISDLPRNIKENILERMPLRDAARTSILSTKWRSIWTTISQLVLDNQFFKETLKNKPIVRHELVGSIEKILLLHNGPMPKLILHIPRIKFDCSSDIDRWILFLSSNGIKGLTLSNSDNTPYKLHSCIYSCTELTHLSLFNCILRPPHESSAFHNLISLHLKKIAFARDALSSLLSRCPLLVKLSISLCSGIGYLNISAPKLQSLVFWYNHEIESIAFMEFQNLYYIAIALDAEMVSPQKIRVPVVVEFLGNSPRIETLNLDGFFLKVLAAGSSVPRRLPTTVNLLKSLTLRHIGFNDLDHISCLLCLVRSCPNLMKLEIWSFSNESSGEEEPILNNLEAPDCMDQMLDKLAYVKIRYITGFKSELLFIKLMLAHSPMLQTMFIEHNSSVVDVQEALRILKELTRFPRLSPKAEIIY